MPLVGWSTGLNTESVTRGNEGFSTAIDEVDEIKLCSDNAQGFLFFFKVINPRDFRVKARTHSNLLPSMYLIITTQM